MSAFAKVLAIFAAILGLIGSGALWYAGFPIDPKSENTGMIAVETATVLGPGNVTFGDYEARAEREFLWKARVARAGWVTLGSGFLFQLISILAG